MRGQRASALYLPGSFSAWLHFLVEAEFLQAFGSFQAAPPTWLHGSLGSPRPTSSACQLGLGVIMASCYFSHLKRLSILYWLLYLFIFFTALKAVSLLNARATWGFREDPDWDKMPTRRIEVVALLTFSWRVEAIGTLALNILFTSHSAVLYTKIHSEVNTY